MRRLFEFIIAKRHWFLFVLLEAIAFFMLLNSNMYNKSMYLYVNNKVVGSITQIFTEYKEYISLKDKNEELRNHIARLEGLYLQNRQDFEDYKANTISLDDSVRVDKTKELQYLTARVVNINKYQDNVFYVIDKGLKDGIRKDLGVISSNGVVGSIMTLSDNYAIVIPILNPMMQLSCSVLHKEFTGSLNVDKRHVNSAILSNVPSHINISKGDTVITSGFSEIFPRGMIVGTISNLNNNSNSRTNYFEGYNVRLSTNFDNLTHVYIILNEENTEVDSLINKMTGNQ